MILKWGVGKKNIYINIGWTFIVLHRLTIRSVEYHCDRLTSNVFLYFLNALCRH